MVIQSSIRLFQEERSNNAQRVPLFSHTFDVLGSLRGSHPWVSSPLSPGCSLPTPQREREMLHGRREERDDHGIPGKREGCA